MAGNEFRPPWTGGARAYPEADTFAAALEGFKRKRKNVMFHMPNSGEAGTRNCVNCKALLRDLDADPHIMHTGGERKPDTFSTWHYDAKSKRVYGGQHYGCSWSNLLTRISQLHI